MEVLAEEALLAMKHCWGVAFGEAGCCHIRVGMPFGILPQAQADLVLALLLYYASILCFCINKSFNKPDKLFGSVAYEMG